MSRMLFISSKPRLRLLRYSLGVEGRCRETLYFWPILILPSTHTYKTLITLLLRILRHSLEKVVALLPKLSIFLSFSEKVVFVSPKPSLFSSKWSIFIPSNPFSYHLSQSGTAPTSTSPPNLIPLLHPYNNSDHLPDFPSLDPVFHHEFSQNFPSIRLFFHLAFPRTTQLPPPPQASDPRISP